AGIADLAVDEPPLDADAPGVAEPRLERGRSVALAPVRVRAVAVEGLVAVARRRGERALAGGEERRALALPLIAGLARRPPRPAPPAGAREDLDHAPDRVRTVEGRVGPAGDLDALDVLGRHPRPVVPREVGRVHPHAVDEDERLRRARAAREEGRERAGRAL